MQAVAGFSFTTGRRHWGEFHARLSRMPRGDASVMLQIGDQPFLLATRDGWAWSRGPLQAQAIIAAARGARPMRVESRDQRGRASPIPTRSTARRRRSTRRRRAARCGDWQNPATAPR